MYYPSPGAHNPTLENFYYVVETSRFAIVRILLSKRCTQTDVYEFDQELRGVGNCLVPGGEK